MTIHTGDRVRIRNFILSVSDDTDHSVGHVRFNADLYMADMLPLIGVCGTAEDTRQYENETPIIDVELDNHGRWTFYLHDVELV